MPRFDRYSDLPLSAPASCSNVASSSSHWPWLIQGVGRICFGCLSLRCSNEKLTASAGFVARPGATAWRRCCSSVYIGPERYQYFHRVPLPAPAAQCSGVLLWSGPGMFTLTPRRRNACTAMESPLAAAMWMDTSCPARPRLPGAWQRFGLLVALSQVQWGTTLADGVHRCAALEQQRNDIGASLGRGGVQRCPSAVSRAALSAPRLSSNSAASAWSASAAQWRAWPVFFCAKVNVGPVAFKPALSASISPWRAAK
ncbi:MAG: hypothetical protein CM1200mP29_07370 [Verrucomicrobiota bacterium]|nr:MAG: hypothetical protein CM1200mP29_07370 [Verrucomicrobiota bacterium]